MIITFIYFRLTTSHIPRFKIGTHINFYYRHVITYFPADNCKADARCSPISDLPPDQVALAAAIFTHCFNLVFQDVVCVLSLVSNSTNFKITNADNAEMYSNVTDVLWTISNISYNVTQMRYDENDGRGNETNTR